MKTKAEGIGLNPGKCGNKGAATAMDLQNILTYELLYRFSDGTATYSQLTHELCLRR